MKNLLATLVLAAFVSMPLGAIAADEAKPAKPDMKTMISHHEKAAEMHKKAAECLKEGKAPKECHEKMMKDCPCKEGDCPCGMMIGHGHGMHKGMKDGGECPHMKKETTMKEKTETKTKTE